MLALGVSEVGVAIEAEEVAHCAVADVREQGQPPAEGGGRDAHRRQRVSGVVLAVAKGALAVLPGLPPVNRGEPDEERAVGKLGRQSRPRREIEIGAPLEAVFPGRVVVDGRAIVKPVERRQDPIALRRVEVSTRGIGAQRPRGATEPLPGGERQGISEEHRQRRDRERRRRDAPRDVELPVRQRPPGLRQRKPYERRALVAPEGVGLRRPIHHARRGGIAMEVVLRPLVIGEDHVSWCFPVEEALAGMEGGGHGELPLIYAATRGCRP